MKFSFIGQVAEEQRQLPPGVRFPVVFMCRMLEVTRQGYYEWRKRPVSAHDQKDAELAARIRYLHQERHENRAGIERILWDLQEEGHVTSERRVRRLARAAGLQCVHPGPSARTTVQDSKAIGGLVDLVDRQFTAPEPDQLWVGDITYIWTYSGFAYLATLIDMCSNKVVGWAVDDHMRTGLVLEALDNALAARGRAKDKVSLLFRAGCGRRTRPVCWPASAAGAGAGSGVRLPAVTAGPGSFRGL